MAFVVEPHSLKTLLRYTLDSDKVIACQLQLVLDLAFQEASLHF